MKQTDNIIISRNQDRIAVLCCLAMFAGLLFSRALLSLSMFVMILNALYPTNFKLYFSRWKNSSFCLLCFAFFLTYVVSGLWSGNKEFWLAGMINKLPFALLPFAFFSVPLNQPRYLRLIAAVLAGLLMLVVLYSLIQLGLNTEYYIQGYNVSRPLPTTKYGDHIRFSLSLVFSILISCYLLLEEGRAAVPRWMRVFLVASIVLFIVYIHILAAKTGLLCLYLAALLYIVSKVYQRSKMLALVLGLGVAALPVAAYYLIPTFRIKIDYVFYEVAKYREEKHYDYTLSDAGRMITYEIGSKAIAAHPLAGVGSGDIMDEMRAGYRVYYPEVASDQQYGPINQFMFTALGVGIPLCCILLAMMLSPFFIKRKKKIYLVITALLMLVSVMVESMLELQFGVFTYLFFILFWLSVLREKKPEDTKYQSL